MPGWRYVYGVMRADRPAFTEREQGVDGAELEVVESGSLMAITSAVRSPRVRPSRANLTVHQRIVDHAHRRGPVLPVSFGTVLPGRGNVTEELLEPRRDDLESMLSALEGKDEFRVRARYVADAALREVASRNRRVRRLREQVNNGRGGHGARIALGEEVLATLQAIREQDGEAVLEALAPWIVMWVTLAARDDSIAAHFALLVERPAIAGLEKAAEDLGRRQEGRMTLELVGPLAPWDFAGDLAEAG
jgi:hypothetical protein